MKNEILWNTEINKIIEDINFYNKSFRVPSGFSENEFYSIKEEVSILIQKYSTKSIKNKKIFLTGHQSEIFHPGILYKDIILSYLSKKLDAIAVHVIVDTDAFEFPFFFPEITNSHLSLKKYDYISDSIYLFEKYNQKEASTLKKILLYQKEVIPELLETNVLSIAISYIDFILELLENQKSLHEIAVLVLKKFIQDGSLDIVLIPQSELIQLNGFTKFIEVISKKHSEFIHIHNESLIAYRKLHKIKNHAQPLPEMKEDELPFWELDEIEGKREPAGFPMKNIKYIPRAITNTMFFRIFFSDIFIHGKGGARYEQISDEIIRKFFNIHPSPYYVASANLYLEPREKYPIGEFTILEFQQYERDLHYSPEKFLSESDPLFQEKKNLLLKFKEQGSDKKLLNQEKLIIDEKIKINIQEKFNQLSEIKKNLSSHESNRETYFNRSYPFFYYNTQFLFEQTEKYFLNIT